MIQSNTAETFFGILVTDPTKLAELRKKINLNQSEFSAATGVSVAAISLHERGKTRPIEAVLRLYAYVIAQHLGGVDLT